MNDARVAVAAGSRIAADAGAEIAGQGGNAVDAAIAAALVSLCTDIGVVSPGGGAFVAVLPPGGEPLIIDGYAEMPGRAGPAARPESAWEVRFNYMGETRQRIGFGAAAVPGALAALASASRQFGRLSWCAVMAPAIRWTERGAPLTGGAAEYLLYTHAAIYSWHPDSYRIVHDAAGRPREAGDVVRVPHLSDSLQEIAERGVEVLYRGPLGQRIAAAVQEAGGLLGEPDLVSYRAVNRLPITRPLRDWQIATNPVPSVGGSCLAAMLDLLEKQPAEQFDARAVAHHARVQHAVLSYRRRNMDGAGARLPAAAERLLRLAYEGQQDLVLESPATIHVSAADDRGCACAITSSAGYGSGAIAPGTGIWLNNSLGEVDLLTRGLAGTPPGSRLASNMAPTVARRRDGEVLAIGTPGASRITTTLAQVLQQHIRFGLALEDAVRHPRLHVELLPRGPAVSFEPGLPVGELGEFDLRPFTAPSMYFGGVQVASWSPKSGLFAVGDSRRSGCIAYG